METLKNFYQKYFNMKKSIEDLLGNYVHVGDKVLLPSPSKLNLDRRDLISGTVTKVYPRTVEVLIRGGHGSFAKVSTRSFVLEQPKSDISYVTSDKSLRIEVQYKQSVVTKHYSTGKTPVVQTQCLVYVNGYLDGVGTVACNHRDTHNPATGHREASKKAFECINLKFIRTELWKRLDDVLKGRGLL
tara:strand:- start:439 stop:999 length:561 start_codon:yes stop_codon:yes gene_type:complete